MRHLHSLARNGAGASALEFALVVPVFLAIIFGIADLGRYLLTQHSLDTLVSVTARAVVVNCGKAPPHYGTLAANCGDLTTYGPSDDQKHNAAPFLYSTGQVPQFLADTSVAGQIKITVWVSSFTFFLPVAGIIPGWSSKAAEGAMTSALKQTATLYY